jgi:uncharacterized protein (DUF1778 family)
MGYIRSVAAKAIKRRKAAADRRTQFLRVRVTAEQQEMFKEAAASAGITVSSWAVERLVSAAKAERKAEAS